ncbi:hypothetical protein [uncultured Methylobacterium sp.]|uniref:hypothetical protein n=1 Tax=uncultured Methylobacterium sp. TaxID=157278 RepID=UPI0035CAE9F9
MTGFHTPFDGAGGGSSGALVPYPGQGATRSFPPDYFYNVNKQQNSRILRYARTDIINPVLRYANYYIDGPRMGSTFAKIASGAAAAIDCGIEFPLGTYTQGTFGGVVGGTIANGGELSSDPITITIPKGSIFVERNNFQCAAGIIITENGGYAALGDKWEGAVSGLANKVMGGTISNASFVYAAISITSQIDQPSWMPLGDSLTRGLVDTIDPPGDKGFLARLIGPSAGYILAAEEGLQAAHVVANNDYLISLASSVSHVPVALGTNDILIGGKTAAQIITSLAAIYNLFPTKKVLGCTIIPSPVFTAPQHVIRQTVNDFIRSRTHFELADPVETDRNSNTAKTGMFNADNIHLNQTGFKTVAAYPPNVALLNRLMAG